MSAEDVRRKWPDRGDTHGESSGTFEWFCIEYDICSNYLNIINAGFHCIPMMLGSSLDMIRKLPCPYDKAGQIGGTCERPPPLLKPPNETG